MGFADLQRVVETPSCVYLLFLSLLITICAATVCPPGEQYWDPARESCTNCTRCDVLDHVVLRPCEVHRDTLCGPLSQLEIDWSWLGSKRNQHRHHHVHRQHRERNRGKVSEDTATISEQLVDVTSTETPFSSTEALIWDWQAVALTLAVFACVLFFLIAGLYSIHQARQWKRLMDNFEADVEELSARLNLMVTSGEITENLEPNTGTINDGNYLSNHCVYLEQLLVRKDSKIGPGNVYIEESNTNASSKT